MVAFSGQVIFPLECEEEGSMYTKCTTEVTEKVRTNRKKTTST